MENKPLKYTCFYPDIMRVKDVNGNFLRQEHALVFGFWRSRENMRGWNSYENPEASAEAIGMGLKNYKNCRTDLINAGLLIVERGMCNSITKVQTVSDDTVLSLLDPGTQNGPVSNQKDTVANQKETATGVPPLSRKHIRKNESAASSAEGCGADAPSPSSGHGAFNSHVEGPSSGEASFLSLSGGERSEPCCHDDMPGPPPAPAASGPFDVPVNIVRSVKPVKDNSNKVVRATMAKVAKILRGGGVEIADGDFALLGIVKGRISEGYSPDKVITAFSNYVNNAPVQYKNKLAWNKALAGWNFNNILNNNFASPDGGSKIDPRNFV